MANEQGGEGGSVKRTAQETKLTVVHETQSKARREFGDCGYAHLVAILGRLMNWWSEDKSVWESDLDIRPINDVLEVPIYELRETRGPLNTESACVLFAPCEDRREIIVLKIESLEVDEEVPKRWVYDSEDALHTYLYGEDEMSLKEFF